MESTVSGDFIVKFRCFSAVHNCHMVIWIAYFACCGRWRGNLFHQPPKLFSAENSHLPQVFVTVGIAIVLGLWALGVFFQVRDCSRVVFPGGEMDTFSWIHQVKELGFSSAPNVYVLVDTERIFVFLRTKKAWAKQDLSSLRYPKQVLQGRQKDNFLPSSLCYWSSISHCTVTVSLRGFLYSLKDKGFVFTWVCLRANMRKCCLCGQGTILCIRERQNQGVKHMV